MSHLEVVRETAQLLGMLDERGVLMRLTSLAVIELLGALEQATGLTVPTANLRQDSFESLETIAELFDKLGPGS